MIIMGQHKRVLYNFKDGNIVIEPVTKSNFATNGEIVYEASAYDIIGGDYKLGRYQTLERAQEILQDIYALYMPESKYEMPEE